MCLENLPLILQMKKMYIKQSLSFVYFVQGSQPSCVGLENLTQCNAFTHLHSNLTHFNYLGSDVRRELPEGVRNHSFQGRGILDLRQFKCIFVPQLTWLMSVWVPLPLVTDLHVFPPNDHMPAHFPQKNVEGPYMYCTSITHAKYRTL